MGNGGMEFGPGLMFCLMFSVALALPFLCHFLWPQQETTCENFIAVQ